MKFAKYSILLYILIVTLLSCKKTEPAAEDKTVPVQYLLSTKDKALFNAFSNNMAIRFVDSTNSVLDFKADSIDSITTCLESDSDKGEALSIRYNCLTNYFPDYSFNCRLSARPDDRVDLSVTLGTGTNWNNRNNDYVLSTFIFSPNNPVSLDTTNYFGSTIDQIYLDSIVLHGTIFYDVILSENALVNSAPEQTKKCYYTTGQGIIAFENNDGKLWVRQ